MGAEKTLRIWSCRGGEVSLSHPIIMGVVNVTPDSFSDGGESYDTASAVAHGKALVADSADIVDVGGESTRPGAEEVSEQEEAERVLPVVAALADAGIGVPISIDTRHPNVARQAVEIGASIINCIEPLGVGSRMAQLAAATGCGLVVMHMRGEPSTMRHLAEYEDVVGEVERSLARSLKIGMGMGLPRENMVIDPGIGFAKTMGHNLSLLAHIGRLARVAPVMIGASRKSFIGEFCHEPAPKERLGGTLGATVWAMLQGAAIFRVHDVKATRQALTMANELSRLKSIG